MDHINICDQIKIVVILAVVRLYSTYPVVIRTSISFISMTIVASCTSRLSSIQPFAVRMESTKLSFSTRASIDSLASGSGSDGCHSIFIPSASALETK
mmetsp:Transcript_18427/g.30118  ORF Transcript_18427/g.30118 Transcript_18427/m.30118 type:complete len:98 (-) Transcript_18427:367-660(-)